MKIYILIALSIIVTSVCFSQDVLLFEDGNKKDAKILEITPEYVKYQKFNSTSKVIYTEDKYNLIGIIFEDGEFEKFESSKITYSKKSASLVEITSDLGDYGSSMFFFEPLSPILGAYIGIGYQHFSKSGASSITIPLRIQVLDYSETYDSYGLFATGFKQKFFPTGSNGGVRGFLGYAVNIGTIKVRTTEFDYNYNYNYYSGYMYEEELFFNETQFVGGVQFHPSKLVNITLEVGLGPGFLDFDNHYFSWDAGLNVGFRF